MSKKRPLLVSPGVFGTQIDVLENPDDPDNWTRVFPVLEEEAADKLLYLKMTEPDVPGYTSRASKIDIGYDELLTLLAYQGYSEDDGTLIKVPYDWRYGFEKSVGTSGDTTRVSGQDPIARTIYNAASQSGVCQPVNILCHSMGCLATLYYVINNIEDAGKYVNKIVFLAPPFLGTVEAYKRIIGGYGPEDIQDFLTNTQWKEIFQNMKGIYQLCPGEVLTEDLGNTFLIIQRNEVIDMKVVTKTAFQDFNQSYAINGDEDWIQQVDGIINCDLLREVAAWRLHVDQILRAEADQRVTDFMRKKSYLFWGLIENSTTAHVFSVYNNPDSTPLITEHQLLGDHNVLYQSADQLPAAGQLTFWGLTHMDMVTNSKVIDTAVDILEVVEKIQGSLEEHL